MNANIIGNLVVPFLIFVALAIWNGVEGGGQAVTSGLIATYKTTLGVSVVIVVAFLITGQAQVLVGRHLPELIEFLNGKHGHWGSAGAGIVTPTLSSYPIVQELWQKGLLPLGATLSVIISARLLNFQTILFFLPFLGWELTMISFGVNLLVAGLFVLAVKLFG